MDAITTFTFIFSKVAILGERKVSSRHRTRGSNDDYQTFIRYSVINIFVVEFIKLGFLFIKYAVKERK